MEPQVLGTINVWQGYFELPEATPLLEASDLASTRPEWYGVGNGWNTIPVDVEPTPTITDSTWRTWPLPSEPVWLPWTLHLSGGEAYDVVSAGLGATSCGAVLWGTGPMANDATDVLPSPGIYSLMNPGQLTVEATPFGSQMGGLTLLAPGLQPRFLAISLLPDAIAAHDAIDNRARDAVTALNDVMRWLHLGQEEASELCHVSVRATHYWSSGRTVPRPSSVRRLYEVHALVASLVRAMGRRRMLDWMEELGGDGTPRSEALRDPGGPSRLLREASSMVFEAPAQVELARPEILEIEEEAEFIVPPEPDLFAGPPRRTRRARTHPTT